MSIGFMQVDRLKTTPSILILTDHFNFKISKITNSAIVVMYFWEISLKPGVLYRSNLGPRSVKDELCYHFGKGLKLDTSKEQKARNSSNEKNK